jgi:penicillin-binding protein 2
MGIGQGPVQWTPMQAATAYAALARGGYWKSPTLFADPDAVGHKQVERDLALDPKGVEQALQGLYEGINANYGTGHQVRVASGQSEPTFNIPGLKIMGKSGTAEAVPLRLVPEEEFRTTRRTRVTSEDPIVRKGDHAWMIILVQPEGQPRARYVVAVVVEYGGTGGAVAGPVANQVLHAMRAEGYL